MEDIGSLDASGNTFYTIGNPGYGRATIAFPGVAFPKAVRDYDAVEVVGRKLLDRNWALTASYVWSRLYGNYSGLSESDENGRTEPNIGGTFDSAIALFDETGAALYGPLATDRPHQAKTQLDLRGADRRQPRRVPVRRQRSTCDPRGDVPAQQGARVLQGRASDGRTPVLSQTDLNAHNSHGRRHRRITVGLNVTNVFNQSRGISRYSIETDQGDQVDISQADYYGGKTHVGAAIDQQT